MNRLIAKALRIIKRPSLGIYYLKYLLGYSGLRIGVNQAHLVYFQSFSQWESYSHICPMSSVYLDLLASLVSDNPDCVCVDIGANIGLHCGAWGAIAPNARIYAFEPLQQNFVCLLKNLRANNQWNTQVRRVAVSDASGTLRFRMNAAMPQNAKIDVGSIYPCEETVEIEALTVDDFVSAERIDSIALLKVDAEGAEARILRGARRALKDGVICAAIVELGPWQLADFGDSVKTLLSALEVGNGTLHHFGPNGKLTPPLCEKEVLGLAGGDLLFLGRKCRSVFEHIK